MNKSHVVAITGVGTLTPAGRGIEALWVCISSGHTCLAPIDPQKYFDPSLYACQVAGQVPSFSEPRVLTDAIMAQTDRCSQMALVAVLDALDMARLPIDFRSADSPVAPSRVSLAFATIAAGWGYLERQMHNLWEKGVDAMDRYGLTGGFLAGPQGHISILFGVEGRVRTFISERASGAHALIEGAKVIQRGDADIAIVGGAEAPLTPLAWAAYHSSHLFQPSANRADSPARPHTGMYIGEGSTFLVLEEREHALRRQVPILAEIHGWSKGMAPYTLDGSKQQPGKGLAQAIHSSLAQADIQPSGINVLFPGGPALAEEERAEEAALKSIFDRSLPMISPKTVLGHLQGAATATDVALATLVLDRQILPTTEKSPGPLTAPMKDALVLSSGLGGMYASLIICKCT